VGEVFSPSLNFSLDVAARMGENYSRERGIQEKRKKLYYKVVKKVIEYSK
jgi:hypothetical protein